MSLESEYLNCNYNDTNFNDTLPLWNLTDFEEILCQFYARYPTESWRNYGMFDEDYLSLINVHWLQFPPAPASTHYFLAVLYGILMVIGCSGNLLVMFLFLRCYSIRTNGNYLILNLAASDFLMMAKTPIFIYNSILCGPALGSLGCKVYGFIGGLSGTLSILSLAAIGLERYRVIAHPLKSLKKSSESSNSVLTIVFLWTYSLSFSSLPLLGLNNYVSEGYLTSCSFDYLSQEIRDRIFIFVFFVGAWVVPMVVLSFSYVSIVLTVRKAEKIDIFNTGRESFKYRKKKEKYRREVRVAAVCSVLVGIWVVAWTPYAIVALLGIFGGQSYLSPLVSSIPALFCKSASCLDPYIYSMSHPKFKTELRKLFTFNKLRRRQESTTFRSQSKNHGPNRRHRKQRQMVPITGDQDSKNSLSYNSSGSCSYKTENFVTANHTTITSPKNDKQKNSFQLVTVHTNTPKSFDAREVLQSKFL